MVLPELSGCIQMAYDKIKAIINGQVVADITESTYTRGMAGLESSFHLVDFDNLEVK